MVAANLSTEQITAGLDPEWKLRLRNRLILDAALDAGWQPLDWFNTPGWHYPLYRTDGKPWLLADGRVAMRWKAFDSAAQYKYLWGYPGQSKDDNKVPEGCYFYWMAGGTVKADIAADDGTLYIACGEPDMLTLVQAGRRNTTCFLGEGRIPQQLAEMLLKLDVKRVVYYPDNDNPGWDNAQKLHDMLAGSGIEFEAYRLPDELNATPIKDLNDLRQAYWTDREFLEAIARTKRIVFLTQRDEHVKREQDNSADWQRYHEAIERTLGAVYKNGRGWSNPIACIFASHEHDDRKPAAAWHKDKHVYRCQKCGQSWHGDEVADRLGIERPKMPEQMKLQTAVNGSAPAPAKPFTIHNSDDALERYKERLDGIGVSEGAPIPFPFKVLHPSVRAVRPRKLIGVIGLSGGGKTSFVECLSDPWRQLGFHMCWWGPEWTWEEMADRAIQRYGGASMTDMMLHEMAMSEEKENVPHPQRLGTLLPEATVKRSKTLADDIARWAGKCYYVDQMDVDIDELLNQTANVIDSAARNGRRIRIAVWDYVQLMNVKGMRGEGDRIAAALGRIKGFVTDYNLLGIVSSQVTKSSTKESKEGGDLLTGEDGQFFRDDKFNLVMTLNPLYDGNGKVTNRGVINVVKNSFGKRDEYPVGIDLARLRWLDAKAVE